MRGLSTEADQQNGQHHVIRSREEYELFLQRYDRYPRSVLSWPPPMVGRPRPRLLSDVLRKDVDRLLRSKEGAWSGVVVSVEEGDGKTWSAAAVDRVVGEHAPALPRRHLTPERPPDGFPQIAEVIPKRRLIALAQDTGAAPPLPSLRRGSIAMAALAVLGLGAVIAVLQALTESGGGGAFNPLAPLVGASLAMLLLLSQEVSVRLKRSEREADERRLIEALDEAPKERRQTWRRLIEELSGELEKTEKDRAVIVDDFDLLDEITRETLRHYLTHRKRASHAHELWVVFEDAELSSLGKDLRLARTQTRPRRVRIETLRQIGLDEQARSSLASEVGRPDRADFRLVKSIAGRESDASDVYGELLDGQYASQRGDGRAYGPLEVAYLLAVHHRSGAWAFRGQELVSDLSSGGSSAHQEVLQLLLPGATFNRSEVGDAIARLELELKRTLDPDRLDAGEIELMTEGAELLVDRREPYRLPAEGRTHLFWALYWHSKLVGVPSVDPYRLRKLARHLVAATTPGALGAPVSEAVRERFRDAAIWTARALLAASLPDDVPTLLLRAELETSPDDDRAWLRSVCWQAYAVLGGEDLLALILRLHPDPAGTPSSATELDSLFVESLRFADRSSGSRSELSERLPTLDREIVTYAQMRGLWLAMTLDNVADGTWSLFSEVASDAAPQAAALVRQALARLGDPTRPRVAIDALTASLGAWCYAIGFLRGGQSLGEANDILEDVRLRAAQLHDFLDERRRQGANEDYVLRSFAHELEAVASAAAVLIAGASASVEASDDDRARLQDHMGDALAGGAAGEVGPVGGIARRMTLQALTWTTLGSSSRNPLGFDQLAALMTLRRAHLTVLTEMRSEKAVHQAMSGLAGQLDERGVVGLMSHAIAMQGSPSREITALLWARAAELALDSGFGKELEAELCLVALACCHSFHTVAKAPLVERLVRSSEPSSGRSFLGMRLEPLDDETRRQATLWLLNSAGAPGISPDSSKALVAETKAMRDHAQDENLRDEIQQRIELFEIEREAEEDQPVPAAEILAQWEHRRSSRHYPWLLHLLIRQPGTDGAAFESAASYLVEHPDVPSTTGPIILALDLARLGSKVETPVSDEQRETALAFLDRVHPSMEFVLDIETNIDALNQLLRHSVGDSSRHRASLEQWVAAGQERDGLRKLPELVEAGKFFLVLWHYYETLYFFGLDTESKVDVGELMSTERQPQVLDEWRMQDEPIPQAMVASPTGQRLSADFLRYGRALFGGAAEDPDLEDSRSMFNETAREALPALFDQLTSLRSLPDPIRSLLNDHRVRLLRTAMRS